MPIKITFHNLIARINTGINDIIVKQTFFSYTIEILTDKPEQPAVMFNNRPTNNKNVFFLQSRDKKIVQKHR